MTGQVTHANPPRSDDGTASRLIAALDNPLAFAHPVQYIRLIETHISWILLTGNYAYKIKKAVDFGFLDFSTLEKRRFYCEEELRLNRRFAPEIYLELVEIRGSETAPRLHGGGEVIEYAIKMLEFPQQCLLSSHAAREDLTVEVIDAIATRVGDLHANIERADPDSNFGTAGLVTRWSNENMDQIEAAIAPGSLPQAFFELQNWYRDNDRLRTDIDARKQTGFVRECHGDLHLGNMALLGDRVTLFDCIEFNPELRWIDTISEAAFVAMDLQARGYSGYCWRFINRYLEATDDYGGVVLLRYYLIYRALVRAKVEALRVDQKTLNAHSYAGNLGPAFDYIRLARGWVRDQRPGMIVMHGLSGSGKSTIAAKLAEALGAIQIRSDVIRKRLFELTPDTRTESALDRGVYSADATESTYRRLQEIAAIVIDAGFTVILDATFLQQPRRRQMLETQTVTGFKKVIIHCDVPVAELRRRIVARSGDPSEATLEVLEQQQARQQVPDGREGAQVVSIGSDGIDAAGIEQLRNLLAS